MRRRRWIGTAIILGAILAGPTAASADGGAYLDLDGTHYLPGETARVESYVSVPVARQGLFERGPFYLFLAPKGASVVEGRPIPDSAVRVAAISIEEQRGTAFELHASFVVPDLVGDSYGIWVCNDPCTISGFREPLTGTISVVATAREAELLRDVSRLSGRNWSLHRQVRRAERANEALAAELSVAEVARSEIATRADRLETEIASTKASAARTARASQRRQTVISWVALVFGGALVGLALTIAVRRRKHSAPSVVAETIPET